MTEKGQNTINADVLAGIRDHRRYSFGPPHFTAREIEIVRCVLLEKSIREIAINLVISEHTVNNHLRNLYRKCGVNNMVGLIKAGWTAGIIMTSELKVIFKPQE